MDAHIPNLLGIYREREGKRDNTRRMIKKMVNDSRVNSLSLSPVSYVFSSCSVHHPHYAIELKGLKIEKKSRDREKATKISYHGQELYHAQQRQSHLMNNQTGKWIHAEVVCALVSDANVCVDVLVC